VGRHVRSAENLADFLTREGLLPGNIEEFNIKDVRILDFFDDFLRTTFTITEWIQ
jgi:hypothetical protein